MNVDITKDEFVWRLCGLLRGVRARAADTKYVRSAINVVGMSEAFSRIDD
jgi:hypothetical protein